MTHDARHKTGDVQLMPPLWHKFLTGELKMLSKLDLEPKCQGHSRNQKKSKDNDLGNKKHATQY